MKKMVERAEELQRGRVSTSVIKSVLGANSDDQFAAAMKQLEGN